MASRQRREDARRHQAPERNNESSRPDALEGADTTDEPGRLAILTEFHQQVEKLPSEERTVFEMRYYGGFNQAEIAQILNLPPKQVSRRWLAATRLLALWLKSFDQAF